MFKTMKMLAAATAVIAGTIALAQPVRADHIGLSVGMGINVRPATVYIVNPSPVVYSVPTYAPPVYAASAYYGDPAYAYGAPAYAAPVYDYSYSAPAFGYEQTFYQPNFYYGGGYYQTGGVAVAPYYYGRQFRGGFYGSGVTFNVPAPAYRTAPAWAGPTWNGTPSRLTFGPLSRW